MPQAFEEMWHELPDGAVSPRDLPHEEQIKFIGRVFGDILPRAFAADLADILAGEKPDLVVFESGNPGAGIAATAAGIPTVCHGFGIVDPSMKDVIDTSRITAIAKEYGLGDDQLSADHAYAIGAPYIDICPISLQDKEFVESVTRIPLRPVPYAEPGELPESVRDRDSVRPLIYLTLGTAFGHAGVLRTAIDGLAALDADVLVAAGPSVDIAELGEIPGNVFVESWVPQAEVLPLVSLVVHHGGSGTTFGALGAGVPQLFLPQGADQFLNAAAISGIDAGTQLVGEENVTVEGITTAARRLLDESLFGEASTAYAKEIAGMPSPEDVAATLPDYI